MRKRPSARAAASPPRTTRPESDPPLDPSGAAHGRGAKRLHSCAIAARRAARRTGLTRRGSGVRAPHRPPFSPADRLQAENEQDNAHLLATALVRGEAARLVSHSRSEPVTRRCLAKGRPHCFRVAELAGAHDLERVRGGVGESNVQGRQAIVRERFVPFGGVDGSLVQRLVRPPAGLKVPLRITVVFWAIKLLTTAVGESTSDYLVHGYNPYAAVILGFAAFVIALAIQYRSARYVPWAYWLAVLMVAVFGTMAADVLHVEFKVPYVASTIFFAVALAVVFVAWQRTERTLSIHSITTTRRETFYWLAVLATFAMGTATGDLAAYTLNLGFLSAGLIFAAAFLVPALAWRFFGANPILSFWTAYVLTRPLGASFADWTGKSRHAGGLGYGDGPVAFVLLLVIAALVAYVTWSESGVRAEPELATE